MILFSCFILFYISIFGYNYIKNYLQPQCEYECELNKVILPLTDMDFMNIKKRLLKSGHKQFPPSQKLLEQDKYYFTSNTLVELLKSYKNIQEWSSKEVGDVLYILNIDPIKNTRSYSKNIKCFHILLDEFIYYAHSNLTPFYIKN